ncbi:MAG: hypothetical protein ACOY42_10910 [Pseudomonadota bacterium]|jgi:hypothetical protein
MKPGLLPWVACVGLALLSACGTTTVKSTRHTPLVQETRALPQSQLLDVGVIALEPGIQPQDGQPADATPATIRNAEGYYLANQLRQAIESSAGWGSVRLLPSTVPVVDVYVSGRILHSDGETLRVEIEARDSAGERWFQRKYEAVASKYAYERREALGREPFASLFNQIANDLLEHRRGLKGAELERLRTISELRFAADFAPESFSGYLTEDRGGKREIARLPAHDDPTLARIRAMRERDYEYIDTLQQYYDNFSGRMEEPYFTWRSERYDELIATRELKRQSLVRTVGGIAAIVAGVALASNSKSGAGQVGGIAAVGAGAVMVQSGLQKRSEAKLHESALEELGASLAAELKPRIVELEDRTVTLTGNVDAQYQQWRALLREIYQAERGQL